MTVRERATLQSKLAPDLSLRYHEVLGAGTERVIPAGREDELVLGEPQRKAGCLAAEWSLCRYIHCQKMTQAAK